MAKKKVLIWDMDGTLRTLSLKGLMEAYRAIINYAGKNPGEFFTDDLVSFLQWFSSNWWDNIVRIGCTDTHFVEEISKIFHKIYDPHVQLFPWVGATIPQLASKYTQTILTSSDGASVVAFLEKENPSLLSYFQVVVGSEQIERQIKPNPRGINVIKQQIGPFLDYIIIGDSHHDIRAGENAGIQTGLVEWGAMSNIERGSHQWENLNPDYVFEKPEDILTQLL